MIVKNGSLHYNTQCIYIFINIYLCKFSFQIVSGSCFFDSGRGSATGKVIEKGEKGMKRWLASGLAICLALQMLLGPVLPVYGADLGALPEQAGSQVQEPGEQADSQVQEPREQAEAPEKSDGGVPLESPASELPGDSASEKIPESEASQLPEAIPNDGIGEKLDNPADWEMPEGSDGEAPEGGSGDLPELPEEGEDFASLAEGEMQSLEEEEGALEVDLISALPLASDRETAVTVSIDGPEKDVRELTVAGAGDKRALARFDVPVGAYTVTVRADKFADYVQKVEVSTKQVSKIQIYSSRIVTNSKAQPGWMLLGDVNGDHKVNDADTESMLSAIRRNEKEDTYDLNQDGKVDIADLQYIVQSLEESQLSTVETLAIPRSITAENGTTVAQGSLDHLINSGSGVAIQTANGQAISPENPVGMVFDLTRADQTAPGIEGIAIRTPVVEDEAGNTYSNIAEGTITITYEEDGKEVEKEIPLSQKSTGGDVSVSGTAFGASFGLARIFGLMDVWAAEISPKVTTNAGGMLVLDLGTQVAVKRVTIRITGTRKKEQPLVEIAKVEFVNNMENRIPAPQLDIPVIESVTPGNKMLTVSWSKQINITGY